MRSAKQTHHYADFAGQRRKFELRLGEVAELERRCSAGIGGIMLRLQTQTYAHTDIRDAIFLGLVGGGCEEPAATALVTTFVDGTPLGEHMQLAGDIVGAYCNGVPKDHPAAKKEAAESGDPTPATSPPSTRPAE